MSDTTKRRLINQLPVVHQTPDLTAFFGCTVDELFQPGTSDALSGYIGHQVAGSTTNDFYIAEPTPVRAFYQLEPAMISYDTTATATVNYALSYPDAVSYLTVSGADTSDQQRLFETEYYSWSPPINLDMLVNYHQYYWFGNVVVENTYCFNPSDSSFAISLSNDDLTAQWADGVSGGGFDNSAYESYLYDEDNPAASMQAVRTTALPAGAWYAELTIVSGTATQFVGVSNTLDNIATAPGFQTAGNNAVVYTSTGAVYNDSGAAINLVMLPYGSAAVICLAWDTTTSALWFRLNDGLWNNNPTANPTTNVGGFDISPLLVNGLVTLIWGANGSDCQANINFGTDLFTWSPPPGFTGPAVLLPTADLPILPLSVPMTTYSGDGVTTTFALPSSILAVPSAQEVPSAYVNDIAVPVAAVAPISISLMLSTATLAGTTLTFGSTTALMPGGFVIGTNPSGIDAINPGCFVIGTNIPSGTTVVSIAAATVTLSQPVSGTVAAGTTITFEYGSITLVSAPAPGATVLVCRTPDLAAAISGAVTVNVSDINTYGVAFLTSSMRIYIKDASHVTEAWDDQFWDHAPWDQSAGSVYFVDGIGKSVRLTEDSTMLRGLEAQYLTIDRSSSDRASNGWALRNSWVHKDSYAWSGAAFPARQATRPIIEFVPDLIRYPVQDWSESTAPLFMLYDLNGVPLDDPGVYPGSSFVGNRLFGYAAGTDYDPTLLLSLKYDINGYPLFSNDAANVPYTYIPSAVTPVVTPITGLFQYGLGDSSAPDCVALWQPVATPTTQGIGVTGLYNIPINLQANPNYDDVDLISQSTWNPQFNEIISRQRGFATTTTVLGAKQQASGDNNYRDTVRDTTLGTGIVQHVAPLLKTLLLASNTGFDVLEAIRYVDLEYTRFKNKFVRKLTDLSHRGIVVNMDLVTTAVAEIGSTTLYVGSTAAITLNAQVFCPGIYTGTYVQAMTATTVTISQPVAAQIATGTTVQFIGPWLSTALAALKVGHNNSFPFALSPMAGGQYFIPATPTALGLLPAAVPTQVVDGSFGVNLTMLLGHDGSLTPVFGDWRDVVMLELETLIYTNLPSQFQTEARPTFDLPAWIGNRFIIPSNGYAWSEYSAIIAPMFELWAQINRLDYRTNANYDATNPFTWNYHGLPDRFGNILPGNWRGIYLFYYGTFAPQLRPWEMLGFVAEPSWWQAHYGSAPYTSSNTPLWSDLESGVIQGGPRQGTDPGYARSGLSTLIPVDPSGNLLDPIAIGIVASHVSYETGTRNWVAGDVGPIEAAWMYSSSFRFSTAQASFLMKPARFVEQGWDALNIGYVGNQWIKFDTLQRPLNKQQYVHGETTPRGTVQVITGLSQWLVDYLVSAGSTGSVLGNAVRGLSVNLMHQMAGFVLADTLHVATDTFGLLPAIDAQTILYTSPAVSSEVYSGVIIEWTGSAWKVLGYDARNPYFTIIPPNTTGVRGLISLAGASEPAISPWRPGTYYPVQILVSYQNSVYQCTRSNTSTTVFEQTYWTARADLSTNMIQAPRVITYASGLDTTVTVAYGTLYTSYQDIANFLLGWERWLISRGWSFAAVDASTNDVLNWSTSVEEFLSWAQVQWAAGNFIALSPGQAQLNFTAPTGTIVNVEDNITGFFGLINRSGQPIGKRDAIVSRLDGALTLAAKNADIYLARLDIYTIEHALVVNNSTVFANDVYLPLFGLRQERLLLTCNRASDWAGRLDAPGFIITGNTLASSFEKAATDVSLMFDIEAADVPTLRDYARHDIGMQQREYFNNLLLSPNTQFEMYQGMIQEKGTPGVLSALTRSTLVASASSTLQFLEEWGFRIGVFGAAPQPFVTLQLTLDDVRDNPQVISFQTQPNAPLDWIELTADDSRWRDEPDALHHLWTANTRYVINDVVANGGNVYRCITAGMSGGAGGSGPLGTSAFFDGTVTWSYVSPVGQFFPQRTDFAPAAVPTGGPVRTSEVTNTVFAAADIITLYNASSNTLPADSLLWVYNGIPANAGLNWYVDADNGNDLNAGTVSAPFQTLQQAHDVCNPGDVVNILSGLNAAGLQTGQPTVYTAAQGHTVLEIARSGTVALPIVFQAVSGQPAPVILGTQSAAAVHFNAVNYVTVQGVSVVGWNASVDLAAAQADAIAAGAAPSYNGVGILIDGMSNVVPHHNTVRNCTVTDFPNSGILVNGADYITIAGNTVSRCGQYAPLLSGGIAILNSSDIDTNTNYKTYVVGNSSYGNFTQVLPSSSTFVGGNGILIENNQTPTMTYGGRTLVANNLCYGNSGNAIQVNTSGYVDVIYNSTYQNQTNLSQPSGELYDLNSIDCNYYNNICVALPSAPIASTATTASGFAAGPVFANNIGDGGNGVAPPGTTGLRNPFYAGLPGWLNRTYYGIGSVVFSRGNAYSCLTAGMSGETPPTGQHPFNDGGVRWQWLAAMSNPDNPFLPQRGSPAVGSANPAFTLPCDLVGVQRAATSGYDIGCYQTNSRAVPGLGRHPYDVQGCFDIGPVSASQPTQQNTILKIMVPGLAGSSDSSVDPTLSTARIFLTLPMALSTDDVNNYLVIDGAAGTYPELQGVQVITDIDIANNTVDIDMVCSAGNDFSTNPALAPPVRVLRSLRFATVDAINPNYNFDVGALVWVDNYTPGYENPVQWAVLQMQPDGSWAVYRRQPQRIDATAVAETVIYRSGAQIAADQMILNQPTVAALDVIDPLAGLIAGACARDITYQVGYDPAGYTAGYTTSLRSGTAWGAAQVGQVWWNLSTACFLDPYTDILGASNERDIAELQYRRDSWARIAPTASVDIYEWVASPVDPMSYTADSTLPGTVYNAAQPAWVEQPVYNAATQQDGTLYYFWVTGLTTVPAVAARSISVNQIAAGITDPTVLGNAWISPISPFGLLVGNVAGFLDNATTVLKVALDTVGEGCNDQWQLMRPGDATSLPPALLWQKLQDSLAGFSVLDAALVTVPDPALAVTRNTGIYHRQSMFQVSAQPIAAWLPQHVYYYGDLVALGGVAFMCVTQGTSGSVGPAGTASLIGDGTAFWAYQGADGTRSGLLDARAAFLSSVNTIFAAAPLWLDRTVALENLVGGATTPARITPYANVDPLTGIAYLSWMQTDPSYAYEPPPVIEWDAPYEVHTLDQRNDLLGSAAFQLSACPLWTLSTAYALGQRVVNSGNAYVCTLAGVSSGTSHVGPVGDGASIPDGAVEWQWLAQLVNAGGPISVLLSGYANPIPQWSIWRYDPVIARAVIARATIGLSALPPDAQAVAAIGATVAAADQVFSLKTAYETTATSIAERDALPVAHLQRVLVTADVQGFWTIYQWQQSGTNSYPLAAVSAWAGTTRYSINQLVKSDGNIYQCLISGVSGTTPPSGTGTNLADGTKVGDLYTGVTWMWVCGYQLWRAQTYNTADFIEDATWYDTATMAANNLSVNDPPIVTYAATTTASGGHIAAETVRDLTEGVQPTNRFVNLTGSTNGNGGFIWTAYINGAWQTVAIQYGTVALSANFTKPANPVYAVSTLTAPQAVDLSAIQYRDGAWEMRLLVQALRYNGVLLDSEINQIWFDMIKFVHVQQNEVDWAFKTSFLSLLGLNVPLAQSPVQMVNQTTNITDYVDEVIPYRVKIRESTIQYTAPIDDANVHASDFDNPMYLDPSTNLYRPLDPQNAADQVILQTEPWSDWYDNYLTAPTLIRNVTVTVLFDRLSPGVGNWDMSAWDNQLWDNGETDTSAVYRILTEYAPTPGMPPVDTTLLLALGGKEDQEDGGPLASPPGAPVVYDGFTNPASAQPLTLLGFDEDGLDTDSFDDITQPVPDGFAVTPDIDINPPLPSRPGGYDLRAPYYAPNHPEERVPFSADDGLQLVITTAPRAGAPPQNIKVFRVGGGMESSPLTAGAVPYIYGATPL